MISGTAKKSETQTRKKASGRAFEDLKFKDSPSALSLEKEVVFQRQQKETGIEEPSFKARLTIRNRREGNVKTGMSRAEE